MRTFDQWMAAYQVSHNNPTNKFIHKICVPLIMLTVIGMLWSIPIPDVFSSVPYLNWATIFILGCLIFYLTLNFLMFITMVITTFMMCWICNELQKTGILLPFSIIVFVLAWIGQFYGHKIEGKKPSFIQDLAFLLIGPLWVLRDFFKVLGIKV